MDVNLETVPAVAKKRYQDSLAKELSEIKAAQAKIEVEYSAYIKHSEGEAARSSAENERLTAETKKLRAEVAALKAQHAAAQAAWDAADQANAAALASLESQLEEQRSAAVTLQAQLEEARAALELARQSSQVANEFLSAEKAENEKVHAALTALQAANETLKGEAARSGAETEKLRAELSALDAERAAAHAAALASLEAQLEEQRAALVAMKTEHAAARAGWETANEASALALASLAALLEEQRAAAVTLQVQLEEARVASELARQSSQAANESLSAEKAENEKVHAALTALQAANETLKGEAEHAVQLLQSSRANEELAACRAVASKCVFIIGFARSNTTLILSMLNCAANALLLGEANFFLDNHGDNFTEWYNTQHQRFRNQITKSSYAPSFIPDRPHKWWEWLDEASKHYDCIGEKIALSHFHMNESKPQQFRAFHEGRFISARYIFTLRNPTDVLISSAKLMEITTDVDMTHLIIAWLDFMETWADSLRVFPHTMTVLAERFDEKTVEALGLFTGLDLRGAELLINPANRRKHKLSKGFETLARVKPLLEEIYADAVAATDDNPALWQAEQKRDSIANDASGGKLGTVAMTSLPLGRVWLKVRELRDELYRTLEAGIS